MPRNAPIALQRFRICAKIEPNATAIPVHGSSCGKAYCFEPVGFSFSGSGIWNPERGKPFAIDAQNDNPKAIQHQSTNAVRALGMRSSNVQRSSFRLELQQSSEVERNWSRIRVQRQGCEQSQNAEDDEKVF